MITSTSPSFVTITNTTTLSPTSCTIGTAGSPALGATEHANLTFTHGSTVLVQAAAVSHVTEVPGRCEAYQICKANIQPNPDISGFGVLAAFMTTAYLVFALILGAYWYGVLPGYVLQPIDRKLFFARQEKPDHRGRRILEEVVLIFSDQQLLTGVGILLAGYILAFNSDLSYYHWRFVVSLAWLSSTVHLMSLSVLRERLWRSSLSCTGRLFAIGLVFVLLLAALVPTPSRIDPLPDVEREGYLGWGEYSWWRLESHMVDFAIPMRCLWNVNRSKFASTGEDLNALISSLIMTAAFAWKLCQFFGGSRNIVRFWGRLKLESYLERFARRTLHTRLYTAFSKAKYKLTVAIYVILVAHMEFVESFMTNIVLLAYTLIWGTIRLRGNHGLEPRPEAEWEMGFGQILPLLLLAQPALATLEILVGQEDRNSKIHQNIPTHDLAEPVSADMRLGQN
ncbi:hypothetical protein PG993_002547 [Apiospora rasikravindrae]|uniref:Uncharacterized protein n=1 Tax=Apiospora rasikravindrae TaxID=990691 RepID=A0ABR1TX51_9PEZI